MKKSVLLLLLLFFIVFVSAESYEGQFSIDKTEVQLGDSFTITGSDIKSEGEEYNGNAMVIFDNDENTYTLLTNIQNGEFSYEASFCWYSSCVLDNDKGDFDISVELIDLQLDTLHEFEEVLKLSLNDELNIILSLEDIQLSPGDKLELSGTVFRAMDSVPVTNMNVKISLDNFETELIINDENFEYETLLSNKISSNYHIITVIAEDDYGNKNTDSIKFYVIPVPQRLEIDIFNGTEYMPDENVKIKIKLYDQADEEIIEEVKFRLINPKGTRIMKEMVFTDQEIDYKLLEYALPGEWIIKSDFESLDAESSFYVNEIELLDIKMEGQTLFVKNIGNIIYTKHLIINARAEDSKHVITRRTNLNPGEQIVIELFRLFDSGTYTVEVSGNEESFDVEIIDPRSFLVKVKDTFFDITGQAIRSSGSGTSNIPTILMVVIFVLCLVLFRTQLKKVKLRKKGTISPKVKKKIKFPNFKKKGKKEVVDLKERILKDIETSKVEKKEEKKEDKNYSIPLGFDKNISEIKEPKSKPHRVNFDEPFDHKNL